MREALSQVMMRNKLLPLKSKKRLLKGLNHLIDNRLRQFICKVARVAKDNRISGCQDWPGYLPKELLPILTFLGSLTG